MSLQQAAHLLGATYDGDDVLFTGVSTDTRSIRPGDMFVALRGLNFDGHDFMQQAIKGGAVALVVEPIELSVEAPIPVLRVEDTHRGLGCLAKGWRAGLDLMVIAVTGSNGKTTVKEMLASIFSHRGEVVATHGNLNNDIGVPLTLLRLDQHHDYAVIEMGANHMGEIANLADMSMPKVALVTNAAEAHLEGFGNLDQVARAKGEVFSSLALGGSAVINADDPYAGLWLELAQGHEVMTFGIHQAADVSARWQAGEANSSLGITTPKGSIDVRLSLPGKHNVLNALAATAAALAAGADLSAVKAGLQTVYPMSGRLQIKSGIKGSRIIDDTYNANPDSLSAALQVLSRYAGQCYLALGDMAELGNQAGDLHTQAGIKIREAGVDCLYTLGDLAQAASQAFGPQARHFTTQSSMIDALREALHKDTTLLIKGSRRMHMEQVVASLIVEHED